MYLRRCRRDEAGQATILVALTLPAVIAIMWLAIEGGALYAQHQRVQSAADIAALVGAQDLPCSATDTSCINQAESDACTYAAKNGFSCTAGAATGAGADVPPTSCSPYNFIDYGN